MKGLGVMAGFILTPAACSTNPASLYEKAIAEYVQTDRWGTWTDLKFEIVSLETSEVTVADSLKIIRAEFETERAAAIESETKSLQYWLGVISDDPESKEIDRYNENIVYINQRIDAIKNRKVEDVVNYGLPPEQVLAVKAKCRYSLVMPGKNTRQERTDTFILSKDGREVVGKE